MADGKVTIETDVDPSGAEKSVSKLGANLKKVGSAAAKGIAVVGTAVSAAMAASIKFGSEFESSMAKASTLFGDVAVDTDNLNKKMLEMSNATGIAATELNEGLYSALSAGIPVTEDMGEATKFLESSAKLAKAGFTDADTAIAATAKTLNAYGLDVSEADRIQKILIQTQNKGITTVDELGASLAQVTPTAASFGVSFEQVGASLAGMTAAGTPTAQATTQLNSLIAELGKQGTVASENLKKAAKGTKYAGMSFSEMMESGATLNDVLSMMQGEADKSGKSMVDMFSSIEAGKASLALLGSDFEENMKAMSTSADVVGEAYNKVTDTFEAKAAQFKESGKNLGTAIYNGMLEDVGKGSLDVVNGYISQLTTAFNENGIEGLASALGDVLSDAVTQCIQYVPNIVNLAILIIENLVNGLVANAPAIAQGITEALAGLTTGVLQILPQLLNLAIILIAELVKGIAQQAPTLIDAIIDAVLGLIDAILDNLPLILEAGLQLILGLAEGLVKAIPKLVERIPEIIQKLSQSIIKMIPLLIETGIQLLTALVEDLPTIINAIVKAIPLIINAIVDHLDTYIPMLVDAGVQLFIALVKNLPLIIANLIVAVGSIVTSIVSSLIKAIPKLADTGLTLLKSIGSKIGECASWIGGKMKEIVLAMKNAIVSKVKEFAKIGKNIVDGVWEGIKGMKDKITKNVKNFFGGIVDGVKNTLKIHSPSRVFRDAIGKMIGEGVIVGIQSKYKKAKKTASQLATLMYEAAKSKLDYFTKYNDLSLANEVSYWAKIVSSTKKGTQGYKDAMLEYKNAKNELNTQLKQAEQDYADKVSNVKESLIKDIQAVTDAYDSAVTKRKESILGSMDLFKEFTSETDNTSETLLTNLQGQVNALAEWDLMLDNIANRGVDTKFVEELQAMGPSVLADLKQINAMTDEQLNQYVELWNRKSQLAEGRAVEELEGYRQECESQIEQLIKDANANLNQLEKDFNATLKSLGVSTSDKSVSIGKSIVKGLKEGIQSQQSELDAFLNTFFGNITARAQNALSSITGAFNAATNSSIANSSDKLNSTIHNSSVINNQTININEKVSTPDEVVRAIRREERYA